MLRLLTLRLISLFALLVCMAMGVDEFSPQPAFCGFRAGCDDVVHSPYGRPLGIPLPVIGLVVFGGYFLLTLTRFSGRETALMLLAVPIGLGGLGLAAIQVGVLHQTCPLCLLVDAAALVLAGVQIGWPPPHDPVSEPRPLLWGGLGLAVLALPPLWGFLTPAPPVPAAVKALWKEGTISIVEITDFTCTHCRQTHPALLHFLEQNRDTITFTRIVAPRSHHPDSRTTARLFLFAEQQGHGEQAAEALFATDDHSLSALRKIAHQIGLSEEDFNAAQNNLDLDAELTRTQTWVESETTSGLPQIWINDIRLIGEQTESSLSAALKRVERKNKIQGSEG